MKKFASALITFYQKYISPYKGFKCPYYPSCSGYTIEAIQTHGFFKGVILGFWRILRCNPFSHGGFDPVPDEFMKINVKAFNRRKK